MVSLMSDHAVLLTLLDYFMLLDTKNIFRIAKYNQIAQTACKQIAFLLMQNFSQVFRMLK